MDDSISRSRVLEALEAEKGRLMAQKGNSWPFTGEILTRAIDSVHEFIKGLPALDVAPVVHARWIGEKWCYQCTNCGSGAPKDGGEKSPYCPNCGARMDGEADG